MTSTAITTASDPKDLRCPKGHQPGAANEVAAGLWETNFCETCEGEARELAREIHEHFLRPHPMGRVPRSGNGLT